MDVEISLNIFSALISALGARLRRPICHGAGLAEGEIEGELRRLPAERLGLLGAVDPLEPYRYLAPVAKGLDRAAVGRFEHAAAKQAVWA